MVTVLYLDAHAAADFVERINIALHIAKDPAQPILVSRKLGAEKGFKVAQLELYGRRF